MTWKVTNEVGGDLLQASRKACLHSLSSFLTSNFLSNPLLPDLFYSADRLSLRSARPRHPDGDSRLKNWMEEAEELPWTGAPAGRSPGISCPPGASRLPPGLGCSRLKSSVGQDRGHATPVPSSSKIPPQPRGYLHAFPWDRPDPKTLDPGHSPAWRGASSPPPRPLTDGLH
ncbi:uncharacterized protein [Physeter macrocephalus]|uniref:Uncharacterized protein isoform X2 n=1 Tax=Physeter macrocephalus TaxID=9755 RepID=A0A9W2WZP8_PHYMC|nr:uncharacterized protein LOC114487239 isoform X2 [Physeter catodon]